MIPKISKILYATDLSENSAYAFRYAVNSAEKHNATIHILHVLPHHTIPSEDAFVASDQIMKLFKDSKPAILKKIKKRVDTIIQREIKDNPDFMKRITVQVAKGDPSAKILEVADELKPDLLIMGTHSKGIIAHTFLGSVATRVLQRTRIPVFIIPIPKKTDIAFDD
jgi:nucleotide-binding universal stress UspA family protein